MWNCGFFSAARAIFALLQLIKLYYYLWRTIRFVDELESKILNSVANFIVE